MGWKDLIEDPPFVAPWLGGKLRLGVREWWIKHSVPESHGWYEFQPYGRDITTLRAADPDLVLLKECVNGYLVGDRLVADTRVVERVLIMDDQEPFARVRAGRSYVGGPLVFSRLEFPLGPEADVMRAFEDSAPNIDNIKGVTPGLAKAFEFASWLRDERERQRRAHEAREAAERQRRELEANIGTAAGRRRMAKVDFEQAARRALAVGGAEYLGHTRQGQNEFLVRYRLDGQRFGSVVDMQLTVIDSGVCLRDEHTGYRGDSLLALESLPSVIREAIDLDKLVVYRHV